MDAKVLIHNRRESRDESVDNSIQDARTIWQVEVKLRRRGCLP